MLFNVVPHHVMDAQSLSLLAENLEDVGVALHVVSVDFVYKLKEFRQSYQMVDSSFAKEVVQQVGHQIVFVVSVQKANPFFERRLVRSKLMIKVVFAVAAE